jgi:hypothetical protein
MSVCRYYWGFWQNGSYMAYGFITKTKMPPMCMVYGSVMETKLWQLTLVLCVKCMIESIFFLSSRETTQLELGKFASISKENDPNLFLEMQC